MLIFVLGLLQRLDLVEELQVKLCSRKQEKEAVSTHVCICNVTMYVCTYIHVEYICTHKYACT